jgi:putative acetyltransferase
METVIMREIQLNDNAEVAIVKRKVLVDMGLPKTGAAYADAALDHVYENYDVTKAAYFVLRIRV